jgi:hypothetical protein
MRFERIRSRILLAIGLGAIAPAPGCGSTKSPPDARALDAAKTDAATDAPTDSVSIRRPFLIGASLRSSAAIRRDDWSLAPTTTCDAGLDPRTRAALADAWERDALEEHASIAAFARFALQLLSVGAPPELVVAAQRAGLDEIRHARAAFALVRRYSGRDVGPAPLRVDDALGATSLAEIAELTAEEGCVGETLGAMLASEQARFATDPEAQTVLRGLARDEERHADLAWRFVRWAIDQGGDVSAAVTRGVRRACEGTLAARARIYNVDLVAWHAHGRVTCAEARAVAEAGIEEVIAPALRALASLVPIARAS